MPPTYEYKCDDCDHEWEKYQNIKDAPIKKCPECGKMKAKRQISRCSGGFILKDGGCCGWADKGYSNEP